MGCACDGTVNTAALDNAAFRPCLFDDLPKIIRFWQRIAVILTRCSIFQLCFKHVVLLIDGPNVLRKTRIPLDADHVVLQTRSQQRQRLPFQDALCGIAQRFSRSGVGRGKKTVVAWKPLVLWIAGVANPLKKLLTQRFEIRGSGRNSSLRIESSSCLHRRSERQGSARRT